MIKVHQIYCEQCGESEADTILKYANLCNDCASDTLRHEMREVFFDPVCGHPIFVDGTLRAVCVMKYGVEHDHNL